MINSSSLLNNMHGYKIAIVITTGGSSRLQREGPKPANADVIQAHQVYIGKVCFRKGGPNHILALVNLNLARLPPPPGSASGYKFIIHKSLHVTDEP